VATGRKRGGACGACAKPYIGFGAREVRRHNCLKVASACMHVGSVVGACQCVVRSF
jgi:hypothetical protein